MTYPNRDNAVAVSVAIARCLTSALRVTDDFGYSSEQDRANAQTIRVELEGVARLIDSLEREERGTNMESPKATYVVTDTGTILVQLPADNAWGFVLADDDQSWPGGFGAAGSWEAIAGDDPRITDDDRARLSWLFDGE